MRLPSGRPRAPRSDATCRWTKLQVAEGLRHTSGMFSELILRLADWCPPKPCSELTQGLVDSSCASLHTKAIQLFFLALKPRSQEKSPGRRLWIPRTARTQVRFRIETASDTGPQAHIVQASHQRQARCLGRLAKILHPTWQLPNGERKEIFKAALAASMAEVTQRIV